MSTKGLLEVNREKVRENWGKSSSDAEEYISILKQWLKTQEHLPEIADDNMIEFLLTNCKYSVEKTKQNLDMYYTIRSLIPDYFNNSNPQCSGQQLVPKMVDIIVLPKLTEELFRITIIKYKEGNAEIYDSNEISAFCSNMLEVRIHEDLVMGDIIIVDNANLTLTHVLKIDATVIKTFITLLEKVWNCRLKAIHNINSPPYIDKIMAISKLFMKKKMYDRIFLHPNLESLYKHVPREMLPSDYGGQGQSIKTLSDLWQLKFKEYGKRFDKLDHMRVDESLRREPLTNSDIMGYYGNFKKLDVD